MRPDRPENCDVTVLVPTIGRKALTDTVKSFMAQALLPTDRMVILGSGWEEHWVHTLTNEQVEFKWCERSKYRGHENVQRELGDVTTDYWMYLGDDDFFLPGVFQRIREWGFLSRFKLLVGKMILPNGQVYGLRRTRSSIPGHLAIGFLHSWIPRWMEIPDFSGMKDTDLMDSLMLKYTHFEFCFMGDLIMTRVGIPDET